MLWRWRDPKIGTHRARAPRPAARGFAAAGGKPRIVVGAVVALSAAVAAGATAYEGGPGHSRPATASLTAVTRPPVATTSVLADPADLVAAHAASTMFASAPVAVVANADRVADLTEAAARAERAHAPLLLVFPRATGPHGEGPRATGPQATQPDVTTMSAAVVLRTAVRSLNIRAVLDVGVAAGMLAAQLPRVQVTTDPTALPATRAPAPLHHVVVLVHAGDTTAGATAAVATARAAGAQVVDIAGYDPRADPAAISAMSAAKPRHVLAVGGRFGPARLLAARVAVAETGVQLPGGGQVLFPMHRLLALYGYPGTPMLGALGQQGLSASISRIRDIAASYRPLSSAPVIPAFEIIATVAQANPGRDGSYSHQSAVAALRPWVGRASATGMYVILDLQPGRASLFTQAMRYRRLLELPNVGLALDPEWKLQAGQRPLNQIGSVDSSEVNSVIEWLARLTARARLPQKLLVLHQFRLSMIAGEQRLDTTHDDLAIVIHMDGQGTQADKLQTWQAVTGAAPSGVFFGWKNFFVKDDPMLSPLQTMSNSPQPVMISYQ